MCSPWFQIPNWMPTIPQLWAGRRRSRGHVEGNSMYLLLVHWVGVSPLGQPLSPGAGPWWGWGWCHYGHCLFAMRNRLTRPLSAVDFPGPAQFSTLVLEATKGHFSCSWLCGWHQAGTSPLRSEKKLTAPLYRLCPAVQGLARRHVDLFSRQSPTGSPYHGNPCVRDLRRRESEPPEEASAAKRVDGRWYVC